MLGDMLFLKEI